MAPSSDNKPPVGYALVSGDGRRASGLIRRRIAEEGGGGGGSGFLELSLGSIYNNSPSSSAADGFFFSPVAPALSPPAAAWPLDALSVVGAATASAAYYAPPAPAASSPASAFALGLAAAPAAVPGDGNNPGGHVFVLAGNALAAANQGQVVAPPVLPPLFAASDGIVSVPVPVPVPVHGNSVGNAPAAAAADSGATPPAPRSKGAAVALLGATPPPSNRKAPRGNATGRSRRRSGAATDADALAPITGDGEITPSPPFPWATKTLGAHPTLAELIERGIVSVEGEVRCKRSDAGKTISYEIAAKFEELSAFIARNVEAMHDRAPPEWMYPALPDCDKCGQRSSLRPVIAAEKWRINWMFLLLGQTLGVCTLEQLKHFCARTRQHRTGAKDRVLYSTYMELCNQLCPGGPFDMASERKNRTRPFA